MDLAFLHDVVTHTGPLAVAHVDETRSDETGLHEQELHGRAALEQLREAGAPAAAVDALAARVGPVAGEAGDQARHVVATADGQVLLDLMVPHRLPADSVSWGPVPSLMPLLQGLDQAVPHVLVVADSTGADLTVVDSLGRQAGDLEVEGDHDELHKVRGGGWAHRRWQQRVQDSHERNADVVVDQLTRTIDRHRPDVVVVGGDIGARTLVHHGLRPDLQDRVRVVEGLGRADGIDRSSAEAEVEQVLREVRLSRMADAVADLERGLGQHSLAATGRAQVVAAARLASVQTLLLRSEGREDATLWTSGDPLLVGTTAQEVRDLGGDPVEGPWDDVLVRSVLAQGGDVELVDGVQGVLRQGVGAVLRFDVRPGTPGDR